MLLPHRSLCNTLTLLVSKIDHSLMHTQNRSLRPCGPNNFDSSGPSMRTKAMEEKGERKENKKIKMEIVFPLTVLSIDRLISD